MKDDIADRLKALPPELPAAADRFERIAAVAARRRRRRLVASVAVATAVMATGVTAASTSQSGVETAPPAAAALSCPETAAGGDVAGGVSDASAAVDTRARLVPDEVPGRVVICGYPHSGGLAEGEAALAEEVRLDPAGLAGLAEDLTHLPGTLAGGSRSCTMAAGPLPTSYLLGLSYPDGVLWVGTRTDDANRCEDASNGSFTTPVYIADQVRAAAANRRWVPPPDRSVADGDPCRAGRPGRLGQEVDLVPPGATSVLLCRGPGPDPAVKDRTYRAVDVAAAAGRITEALDALETRASNNSCSGQGPADVQYSLRFSYEQGPPVVVRVAPWCLPSVDNDSLQADAGPELEALLESALAGAGG